MNGCSSTVITDELGGNVQVTTHRLQRSLRGFDLEEPHPAVDLECHERPDFLMRVGAFHVAHADARKGPPYDIMSVYMQRRGCRDASRI